MKKRVSDKFWFPWWPEKWLFGSVRIECSPAERGIWVDLLSLASKDDGFIRANEETPYPIQQLAGLLILGEKELKDTIEKFIKLGKLMRTKEGTLYVVKWDKYQFSDRHKRRVNEGENPEKKEDKAEKEDTKAEKTAPILNKSKLKNSKLKNNIKDKIIFSIEQTALLNITKEDFALWENAYPVCDIVIELYRMADWLISNPDKKKKNYRRFITNWLSRSQERGGTRPRRGEKDKKDIKAWINEPVKKEEK